MAQATICDICGAMDEHGRGMNGEFYNVGRYSDEYNEHADICPDCLPDEIANAMNRHEVEIATDTL